LYKIDENGRELKECPYCAEYVLKDAKLCKHCKQTLQTNNESVQRRNPKLMRISIALAIFLTIISSAFVFYFSLSKEDSSLKTSQPKQEDKISKAEMPVNPVQETFSLTIHPKDKKSSKQIQEILEKRNIDYRYKKDLKKSKKHTGYIVTFHLNDEVFMNRMMARLKEKKIIAKLIKGPDNDDIYIVVGGNYKTKNQAEKMQKQVEDATFSKFLVENNYEETLKSVDIITIDNISSIERAESLKKELVQFTDEEIRIVR